MTDHNLNKCKNTGNWIEMCPDLYEAYKNQYGDIRSQVMTHLKTGSKRLIFTAGRFKTNRVLLNFCPFCGTGIKTEFKEPRHD